MIYMFEDSDNDLLSRLFRASYSDETCKKFIYTSGAGKMLKEVPKLIQTDDIAVFIDMLPDNANCKYTYNGLARLQSGNTNRLLIFPIICSEYYMIKYLYDYTNYIDRNKDVNICLDKGDYRKSSVYIYNGTECKNFEHYCKVILRRYVLDCIKHTRFQDGIINSMYGTYYENDCKCKNSLDICSNLSLFDKSLRLLSEYKCVPSDGTNNRRNRKCVDSSIVNIHRELVDDYNDMLNRYIKLGIVPNEQIKKRKIAYAM